MGDVVGFDDDECPYQEIGGEGTCWRYCIPYEGNEALAGTTNAPRKGAV